MPDRAWTLDALEAALAGLPRPGFRARLRRDLERRAAMMTTATDPAEAGRDESQRSAITQTATPVLRVRDAAQAIDFYTRAFGARETMRFAAGGRIPHARLAIGNSTVVLADEGPAIGHPGPDQLGGSPVTIRLEVDDPDAAVTRAVAAGATIFLPVEDHFYGERTGTVVDPFGYRWSLTKVTEAMSVDEMHRRMALDTPKVAPVSVTPYLVAQDAPALIDFVTDVFGADEKLPRHVGSAGGVHAEVVIGGALVMIGGGAPHLEWHGESKPTALHVYVPDVDAVYARALQAGATSIGAPVDQEYGERGGGVKDPSGTVWYIATATGAHHVPPHLQAVNVYLHPRRAEPVIAFMQRALGATNVEKYASADGVIHHARVRVGETVIEMGEAHGPYQPMPTTFFVSVPDADAAYRRGLSAGAVSEAEPADRPFGRAAGVRDPFDNVWFFVSPNRADNH